MDATDLRAWRKAQFVSQDSLAGLLGVHRETVGRWERGELGVPAWLELALETLAGRRATVVGHLRKARRKVRPRGPNRIKPAPEFFEVAL